MAAVSALGRIRDLREREEGQALLLAAVCMLVLALCVMATVNLSYAVSEKIKLQNTLDATAYSAAAHQARAYNFVAYTNRAMAARYAAGMSFMAMTTYVQSYYVALEGVSGLLKIIAPAMAGTVDSVLRLMRAVAKDLALLTDGALASLHGLNVLTSAAQQAVYSGIDPQIFHLKDRQAAAGGYEFDMKAVGRKPAVASSADEKEFNRLLMVEIANSSRNNWVTLGTSSGGVSTIFPRTSGPGTSWGPITLEASGETQWGAFSPTDPPRKAPEQFWSKDRLTLTLKVAKYSINFEVTAWMREDKNLADPRVNNVEVRAAVCTDDSVWLPVCGSEPPDCGSDPGTHRECSDIIDPKTGKKAGENCSDADNPGRDHWRRCVETKNRWTQCKKDETERCENVFKVGGSTSAPFVYDVIKKLLLDNGRRHVAGFGSVPYLYYRLGETWTNPEGGKHFYQPVVCLEGRLPTATLVDRGRPFMRNFGLQIGNVTGADGRAVPLRGAHSGVDFAPNSEGNPLAQAGLTAVSAAMTYYHRPGDWREPPNFFNPFWGAKLAPLRDYGTQLALGSGGQDATYSRLVEQNAVH